MADPKNNVIEKPRIKSTERTDEPPMYRVVLYNDDFTPKAFVVELLVTIFNKGAAEATELMWRVHSGKRGVAGVYPARWLKPRLRWHLPWPKKMSFPSRWSWNQTDRNPCPSTLVFGQWQLPIEAADIVLLHFVHLTD
jgi:ATP-dependent Clp protease adaptor protein ClpS